ncbi:MAG: carboxypeptidase regulatory-like domain-containing protein [Elusimicrobiota bacterium]
MNASARISHRPPLPENTLGSRMGATLIELMITVAILSIIALSMLGAFTNIQKGIQMSKNKTLASNLAQEKMQILKQQTYYRVLPTSTPSYTSDGTPYDTVFFPPEDILQGGVIFHRRTYVAVVTEDSGLLAIQSPTTPDTGMRKILITVSWADGSQNKNLAITSVLSNPNTVETNSHFMGTVRDTSANPIPNAVVNVAENFGWRDTADASGAYALNVMTGNFNLMASAEGYFTQYLYRSVAPNNTTTVDFSLTKMSSGVVMGTAWITPNLVISEVAVSTAQGDANAFIVQYIELYNPTTYTITLGGSPPPIRLNIDNACGGGSECTETQYPNYGVKLDYINNSVASGTYYLIANTNTFMLNGQWVAADAVFADDADSHCTPAPANWNLSSSPPRKQLLAINHGTGVWLTNSSGQRLDTVAWRHNTVPTSYEGTYIDFSADGFVDGAQIVRISSPTSAPTITELQTLGRAYDSDNNSVDFSTCASIDIQPHSTADSSFPRICGVPAAGAVITATDGLSDSTAAICVETPPVARFSLNNVATGTWVVLITSGSYELENDTVTISASGSIYTFPSSTTILSSAPTAGFISGTVLNAFGTPISVPSAIALSATGSGSGTGTANTSNGRYILRLSSAGFYTVTANPNNANDNYIFQSSVSVPLELGRITNDVNFILTQGGRISGFVTRDGTNPLPGVTVVAIDSIGYAKDQQITATNGRFTTVTIATGAYSVQPALDTLETSSPTAISTTVLLGQDVFVGTFTISGALGNITGSVKVGGRPISTGVLIVVTTATLSGTPPVPPTLSTATSSLNYISSSREDGTYTVGVRQSTNPAYNVYGYYTTVSDAGAVSTQWTLLPNVPVTAGETVPNKNFSW